VTIALVAGIAVTGVSARSFFQPTGLLIVVGGTLGVMLITTPVGTLLLALRHASGLLSAGDVTSRQDLIEEMVSYAKTVRFKGLVALEPVIDRVSHPFLKDALLLAMDTENRGELRSVLENKLRFCERQSESSARVLEIAGGYSPTLGVLGAVIGLVDILRQFSSLAVIASGVAVAFTSTIYGLALANLVLLPAAHRVRARALEIFELQALMIEGTECLRDGVQPTLVRQRLESFVNTEQVGGRTVPALESALETQI
jgi:chemotaxis protein MotA